MEPAFARRRVWTSASAGTSSSCTSKIRLSRVKLAEPPQQLRVAGVGRANNDRPGFRVQSFGFLHFGDEAPARKLKVDIHTIWAIIRLGSMPQQYYAPALPKLMTKVNNLTDFGHTAGRRRAGPLCRTGVSALVALLTKAVGCTSFRRFAPSFAFFFRVLTNDNPGQ